MSYFCNIVTYITNRLTVFAGIVNACTNEATDFLDDSYAYLGI